MTFNTVAEVSNSLFYMFLFNFVRSVFMTIVAGVRFKYFCHIVAVCTIGRMVAVKPEIFCVIEC